MIGEPRAAIGKVLTLLLGSIGVAIDGQTILFLKKTGHLGSCTAPALVRSLGSQVVHPVWCGLEIPTLDLVYKGCNCGVHVNRHSGRVA